MTVYRLLEILNKVRNKDLPVMVCRDMIRLDRAVLATEAYAHPDDMNPDYEEGTAFYISGPPRDE